MKIIKAKYFGLVLVVIVFLIFGYFIVNARVKVDQSIADYQNNLKEIQKNPLISALDTLPLQSDFIQNDAQRECPYRKPNSLTYRRCLIFLLQDRDEGIGRVARELIKGVAVNVNKERQRNGGNETVASEPQEDFINSFFILHESWKPYREAICNPRGLDFTLESEQTEAVSECKLYEDAKYIFQLQDYERDLHVSR